MRGSVVGLPEGFSLKGNSPVHYGFLVVLDTLISILIIAPTVIGYWRSVWELSSLYIYPQDEFISAIISTIIGYVGHLICMLCQHFFTRTLHPDKNRITFYVCSRIYTVCFAFFCVNGWRGPWLLLNLVTGSEITPVLSTTLIGIIILILIKGLRNVLAVPFVVLPDDVKGYFEVRTMFKISMEEKTLWYIMDCIFSVFVIGTLVVFVWRGAWVLVDLYLFPENNVFSSWASLIIGYGSVIVAFLLQPIMRWICDRVEGIPRLLIADLFLFFSFFGTINLWRGIWNLLNLYFIPDNIELSSWISHWTCLVLLILLKCSNTLLVRGVYIDAEEPAGKCVVFPIYYLRLIFQHERIKKINKKCESEAVARKKLEMEGIIPPCTCGADIKNYIANNGNEKKHHIQVEKKV